jgi:hypothetical protein
MASSPSPVVNFRTDEEDDPAHRPDYVTLVLPLCKQKKEDLDTVDIWSKLARR